MTKLSYFGHYAPIVGLEEGSDAEKLEGKMTKNASGKDHQGRKLSMWSLRGLSVMT